MGSSSTPTSIKSCSLLLLLVSSFSIMQMTEAGDADILSDFLAPLNADGKFFTYTPIRAFIDPKTAFPSTFTSMKATMAEFPALAGQSVSYDVLKFPVGSINPPHIRPRASGLLFVLAGPLRVGLIDTSNKLYTQTLQTGDMFVFPKGLVHFQYNADPTIPALAIAAFGSAASTGTISIPSTLFNSGVDNNVLAKSFNTGVQTIQALKAGLLPNH